MALYPLTVTTSALGLGVMANVRVRAEKRRVSIADTYPPVNTLIYLEQSTNGSGVGVFQLEPDDLTTYSIIKIYDAAGILVYQKPFSMPPKAVNLEDTSIAVTIGGSLIQFQDEGVAQGTPTTVRNVNFTGGGVVALFAGDTVTVDIPGGDKGFVAGGSGSAVTVEDVLTSTSSVNALSANQGRLLKNLADSKLDATAYNDRYQGVYASVSALQTAKPTGAAGDYATVDTGSGNNAQMAIWDDDDGTWIIAGSVSLSNTDALPEGSTNLYFTNARAQAATLQPTINTQTSNYTLQPVDNDGKTYLRMTSSSANTVTIPSNQTLPISITQRGTGTTTLVADSGVTLNGTLAFSAQHQTKSVIPVGSNAFDVVG